MVVVSHDRHMIELTADRLVLVDDGTAQEFTGSLDDYTDLILGKTPKGADGAKVGKKDKKAAAAAREKLAEARKTVKAMEEKIATLTARRTQLDSAMFDPKTATPADAKRSTGELMKLRADVQRELDAVEAEWLVANEALENAA